MRHETAKICLSRSTENIHFGVDDVWTSLESWVRGSLLITRLSYYNSPYHDLFHQKKEKKRTTILLERIS